MSTDAATEQPQEDHPPFSGAAPMWASCYCQTCRVTFHISSLIVYSSLGEANKMPRRVFHAPRTRLLDGLAYHNTWETQLLIREFQRTVACLLQTFRRKCTRKTESEYSLRDWEIILYFSPPHNSVGRTSSLGVYVLCHTSKTQIYVRPSLFSSPVFQCGRGA